MREERLLERISRWEDGGERSHLASADLLIASILAHLQRILNTRQGSVPIDDTYGVPDFTNIAGTFAAGSTTEIEREITRMIERFEPRLRSPAVRLVSAGDEVLSLRFDLSGSVMVNDREVPLRAVTTLSAEGKMTLVRA